MDDSHPHRRAFLAGLAGIASAQICQVEPGTVRDRLWIFRNPINADYDMVQKRSVISPAESALYLGIPNIIMANQYPPATVKPGEEGWFRPWEPPFEPYAFPLRLLKRVAWSMVGAGGATSEGERRQVLSLARHTPNITTIFLDDFFHTEGDTLAALTLDQLAALRQEFRSGPHKLDLMVTFYETQLERPVADYLKMMDVVTFWTWQTAALKDLERNLARLQKVAPNSRKMLGCYTHSLQDGRVPAWMPLPASTMQQQCETGLRWLRQGRLDGIIIYGTVLDLAEDAVEWTREWIRKVGEIKL